MHPCKECGCEGACKTKTKSRRTSESSQKSNSGQPILLSSGKLFTTVGSKSSKPRIIRDEPSNSLMDDEKRRIRKRLREIHDILAKNKEKLVSGENIENLSEIIREANELMKEQIKGTHEAVEDAKMFDTLCETVRKLSEYTSHDNVNNNKVQSGDKHKLHRNRENLNSSYPLQSFKHLKNNLKVKNVTPKPLTQTKEVFNSSSQNDNEMSFSSSKKSFPIKFGTVSVTRDSHSLPIKKVTEENEKDDINDIVNVETSTSSEEPPWVGGSKAVLGQFDDVSESSPVTRKTVRPFQETPKADFDPITVNRDDKPSQGSSKSHDREPHEAEEKVAKKADLDTSSEDEAPWAGGSKVMLKMMKEDEKGKRDKENKDEDKVKKSDCDTSIESETSSLEEFNKVMLQRSDRALASSIKKYITFEKTQKPKDIAKKAVEHFEVINSPRPRKEMFSPLKVQGVGSVEVLIDPKVKAAKVTTDDLDKKADNENEMIHQSAEEFLIDSKSQAARKKAIDFIEKLKQKHLIEPSRFNNDDNIAKNETIQGSPAFKKSDKFNDESSSTVDDGEEVKVYRRGRVLPTKLSDVQRKFISCPEFSKVNMGEVAANLVALLNSKENGTVFIGVDEDEVVSGIKISRKDRDRMRMALDTISRDNIEPGVHPRDVDIQFVKVEPGEELWVIKLMVSISEMMKLCPRKYKLIGMANRGYSDGAYT